MIGATLLLDPYRITEWYRSADDADRSLSTSLLFDYRVFVIRDALHEMTHVRQMQDATGADLADSARNLLRYNVHPPRHFLQRERLAAPAYASAAVLLYRAQELSVADDLMEAAEQHLPLPTEAEHVATFRHAQAHLALQRGDVAAADQFLFEAGVLVSEFSVLHRLLLASLLASRGELQDARWIALEASAQAARLGYAQSYMGASKALEYYEAR